MSPAAKVVTIRVLASFIPNEKDVNFLTIGAVIDSVILAGPGFVDDRIGSEN